MTTYTPEPGTVAFRVLAYLETLPAGAEIMTSALAEALGLEGKNLIPCLETALAAGRIFRRQRDTHVRSPFWWSLTDYSAIPKAERPVLEVPQVAAKPRRKRIPEGQASQQVLKADPATGDATDRETPADASPRVGAMGAGQPADAGPAVVHGFVQPESAAGKLRIALWNDGALQMYRHGGGLNVLLNPDETRQLVAYLERLGEGA